MIYPKFHTPLSLQSQCGAESLNYVLYRELPEGFKMRNDMMRYVLRELSSSTDIQAGRQERVLVVQRKILK